MSSREAKVAVIGGHLRSDHLLQIISDQIIPVDGRRGGECHPRRQPSVGKALQWLTDTGHRRFAVQACPEQMPSACRSSSAALRRVGGNWSASSTGCAQSWRGLLLDLKTARACYGARARVAGGALGRSRTCAAGKPRAVFGLPESAYRPAPKYTVGLVIGRVRLLSGRSHQWVGSPRLDAS